MPKVGSKPFAYTKKGEAAAKREAAKTGMPMHKTPKKMTKQHAKGMGY